MQYIKDVINPAEIVFSHPRHGQWDRVGFAKVINAVADPMSSWHVPALVGVSANKLFNAFCDTVDIERSKLLRAFKDGKASLSAGEWHRIIVVASLCSPNAEKKLEDEEDKIKFTNQRGSVKVTGTDTMTFQRLMRLFYDDELEVLCPEFNRDSLRNRYNSAKERLEKAGQNLADTIFNPEMIGLLICHNLNQFVDFFEEDGENAGLLSDIRNIFLPEPVVRVALETLQSRDPLSKLGKLIAGASVEFISTYVSVALADPAGIDAKACTVDLTEMQNVQLQQRLLQSDWFTALTDYQYLQADPHWAEKIDPQALKAMPAANGVKAPATNGVLAM